MRFYFVILLLLSVNACATSPSDPVTSNAELKLCKTRVSNAPRTDNAGYIVNYNPFIEVRGITLARSPVSGCLSSGFGPRRGGAGRLHKGIDLYTGEPRVIIAAATGDVIEVGNQRGFGRTILIRHRNGVMTRYAHLSSYAPHIREGMRVKAGTLLGRTGKSGNATAVHLHYEILVKGKAINPLK